VRGARNDPRAVACRRLADLTVMGQGVPADRALAISLYERACQLDAPWGCQEAGALRALEPDATSAVLATQLFADGCASGNKDSCLALDRAGIPRPFFDAADREARDEERCRKKGLGRVCAAVAATMERAGRLEEARATWDLACRGGHGGPRLSPRPRAGPRRPR
jgi:TPR repeat protein